MAVSVLERPLGHIFDSTTSFLVDVTRFSPTDDSALFSSTALSNILDGDYVYIISEVEDYNGFWYVEVITFNTTFQVKRNSTAAFARHVKDVINARFFVVTNTHNWNCVHLPIVYKLSNTLWPANSADTVRTISSANDSNGYCILSLSGDIKASGSAAALEYVKITGDNDFNGVYQIISYSSETSFVIDLPYSTLTAIDITNSQIQYYYNNYHIKVEVWGGLNNGHEYYGQEPYELLATLDLVPDENNEVKFSIHEILKKNIEVKNNLLLGTLPNNLDAWTGFFIKYAEVYDDSDGTTLTTTTPSYTSDLTSFEGKAVNAMLPFKNVYSGALSEYASADSTQKFLTAFTRPTIFEGKYFDLSFLWDGVNDIFFKEEWYLNEVLQSTVIGEDFDAFYTGVYRNSITENCVYDRVDITAYKTNGLPPPSSWTDSPISDTAFDSKTSTTFVKSMISTTGSAGAYVDLVNDAVIGDTVRIDLIVTISGTWTGVGGIAIAPTLVNDAFAAKSTVVTFSDGIVQGILTANGTYSFSATLSDLNGTATRLLLQVQEFVTSGTAVVTITMPSHLSQISSANIISETKTIDINCDCLRSKATGYYLSWLNPYGGFDSWLFTGYADELIDIVDTGETEENHFPEWPNSYGEFADTQRKQTFRTSRRQRLIRSQHVTEAQLSAIENIKTSPLVQIVNSIYDRRTVIVDADSFVSLKEENNLHDISFTITYTDDVPSQKV